MMEAERIAENLEKIRQQIFEAEIKAGREKGSVRLCAVSKFHPQESVLHAMNAGQLLFGENRVQEAYAKFTSINESARIKPELHIIGSLQTNKVKKAVEIASCIQSVDRIPLAQEIQKQCEKLSKKISVFLEIHTGEESKSGFASEDEVMKAAEMFASEKFPLVTLTGLMTMAPFTSDERAVRSSFVTLRNLREKLLKSFPSLPVKELSMGMSGDFKLAVEEGSTMVRIGTAIFGERDYNAQVQ